MSKRANRIANQIQCFVDNPITNLVKGLVVLLIGLSDVFHTFEDGVAHGHIRLGHGLIIIGLFSVLGAFPQLIEGLEAGDRFLQLRQKKGNKSDDVENP